VRDVVARSCRAFGPGPVEQSQEYVRGFRQEDHGPGTEIRNVPDPEMPHKDEGK